MSDDHMILANYESAACAPTEWERWIAKVERILGHDADGDQREDGYSLDGFYQLYLEGSTPQQAVRDVKTLEF